MGKQEQLAISGGRVVVPLGDELCAITDVGRVRERNEDAVYAAGDGPVLIVADGLGGLPAGDVASRSAVNAAAHWLTKAVERGEDGAAHWEDVLREAFDRSQRAILTTSHDNPRLSGMATTLVAGVVRDSDLFLVHVGDVRAYRFAKQGLKRLTNDHSVVGELVAAGQLDEEAVRSHPERNVVTQVLGAGEGFKADFTHSPLDPGDVVLLCSDGLWEHFDAPQLAAVLGADGSAEIVAEALVGYALEAGGHDNISAVVYKHGQG